MGVDQQPHENHEHNNDDFFDALVDDAKNNIGVWSQVRTDVSLESDEQLKDNYQQEDQKEREHSISSILAHYDYSYQNKVNFQRRYRKILFWGCSSIAIVFTIAVLMVLNRAITSANDFAVAGVITIITGILSLVGSILELIHIITKYCFPENDDEYIINIVKSVQSNDLEKYKEYNRAAEARHKRDK